MYTKWPSGEQQDWSGEQREALASSGQQRPLWGGQTSAARAGPVFRKTRVGTELDTPAGRLLEEKGRQNRGAAESSLPPETELGLFLTSQMRYNWKSAGFVIT